jgi:hypothetical protein
MEFDDLPDRLIGCALISFVLFVSFVVRQSILHVGVLGATGSRRLHSGKPSPDRRRRH